MRQVHLFTSLLAVLLCTQLCSCTSSKMTIRPAWSSCLQEEAAEVVRCTELEIVKFVSSHTKYPPICKDAGIQGTVLVNFTVGKDGWINEPVIEEPLDRRLDAEALRVVRLLPQFRPGLVKGKPTEVRFNIPVKFIIR